MLNQLEEVRARATRDLEAATSSESLEQWRLVYLGRRGELTQALRVLGELPPDERPAVGRVANEVKDALERAYQERAEALRQAALAEELAGGALDVRLPGRPQRLGYLHLSTQTLREIQRIFAQMGFQVLRSGEVEDDITNFQLLNMPPDHPARDMWSTFYLDVPEANPAALALAQAHSLQRVFETVRMYKGPAPALPLHRIFGNTSFELG